MTYKEFYTEAIKGLKDYESIDNEVMECAYTFFHLRVKQEPKKAVESAIFNYTFFNF